MIEAIRNIVINVTVIIIVTTILDLLLPEGRMQSLLKLVMGLFVVVTMLNPIVAAFDKDNILEAWVMELPQEQQLDSIMAQGEDLRASQSAAAWQQYGEKLEGQIVSLLLLLPEIERCRAEVSLDSESGALQTVTVSLAASEQVGLVEKVQQIISGYYGLAAEQIVIKWLGEELEAHGGMENQ